MPYKNIAELPDSFKKMSDEAKTKAMAMMNALLKKGMNEGMAIATTLKRVKEMDLSELETEDVLGVEIAKTGPVVDRLGRKYTFTEEDFDAAEASWKAIGDKVINAPVDISQPYKVWLGHDPAQPILASDGMISAGWVTNVRREGKKLRADFMKVPGKIAKLIQAGAWRNVSVGLRTRFEYGGETYRNVLDHVALLGKKPPAIKGLDDLVALYSGNAEEVLALLSDEDLTVIVLSEDDGIIHREEGEDMEKLLKMLREKFELAEDASEDDVIAAWTEFDKGAVQLAESVTALTAQVEEMKKPDDGDVNLSEDNYNELLELAELGKKAFEKVTQRSREDLIDGAIKARKIMPAQRERYLKLAEKNEEEVSALFADMAPMTHLTGAIGDEGTVPEKIELSAAEIALGEELGVSRDALERAKDPDTFKKLKAAREAAKKE